MKNWEKAQANIRHLQNEPYEIDLSYFTLIASCENDEIHFEDINYEKEECDVYAIQFGNDLYIGSSKQLSSRIRSHYYSMRKGNNLSPAIQEAYNKTHSFKVYLIMRCFQNCDMAEQMIIRLLRPSLNAILPKGNTDYHNDIIWTPNRLRSI